MGELRDRMDADLRLRGLSENTRRLYLRCARDFAAYCGRSRASRGWGASVRLRTLIGIGADGWLWSFRQSPPTPPDIRVRIRRFGRLRLAGKPWYSDPVEVAVRQRGVQSDVSGRPPPAFAVGGDLRG